MMQPSFFNATIALILIVGILIGAAWLSSRAGIPDALRNRSRVSQDGSRRSVRVDRSRVLSIVEIDGVRFAILTGGRADQLVFVPAPVSRDLMP